MPARHAAYSGPQLISTFDKKQKPTIMRLPYLLIALFLSSGLLIADGFSLNRAIAQDEPCVLRLTKTQIAQVGRERKLVLNEAQKQKLQKKTKNVPAILGVESLGEPDCSCCISSAMWTNTRTITVWIRRLAYDRTGSRFFYECRLKPGHYTMDAAGRIYIAGKPVTWDAFIADMRERVRAKLPRHLSLPPTVPSGIQRKLDLLPNNLNPAGRL